MCYTYFLLQESQLFHFRWFLQIDEKFSRSASHRFRFSFRYSSHSEMAYKQSYHKSIHTSVSRKARNLALSKLEELQAYLTTSKTMEGARVRKANKSKTKTSPKKVTMNGKTFTNKSFMPNYQKLSSNISYHMVSKTPIPLYWGLESLSG